MSVNDATGIFPINMLILKNTYTGVHLNFSTSTFKEICFLGSIQ